MRFPIAFDTPGLNPQSFAITAWDEPTQTITVAGDQTEAFAAGVSSIIAADFEGSPFTVPGAVVSSVVVDGATVVTLYPATLGDVATYLTATVSVGIPIYTPAAGDMLYGNATATPLMLVSVSESWDGDTPTLKIGNQVTRQQQSYIKSADLNADGDLGNGLLQSLDSLAMGTIYLHRFASTDPLLAWVESSSGLNPGSTQGAGEIVFMVLPAA